VRIDKIRLAGLVATLIPYLKGEALKALPVWRMISMPLKDIEERAKLWVEEFGDLARVIDGESMIGGGSLPGGTLPTKLVAIGKPSRAKEQSLAQKLAQRLRAQEPPIVGRISENVLLLDPRSVIPEEDTAMRQALHSAVADLKAKGES